MKVWIIIILIILCLIFSSCSLHKEPSSPVPASAEESYDFHLTEGRRYLRQNDSARALDHLKKAVAINPDSPKVHNFLGIAYFQQKDYKLAKTEYEKAIDLDSSYAQAYNNLGSVYFMLSEFDKAKALFKKALSLFPNLVSAHYSLGTLLVAQGQVEEGTQYLLEGIKLSPDFLERNKAFIANFSSSAIGTPEVLFTYAKLYASIGNIEKTIEYLTKAKKAGFKDWDRIDTEEEFEGIRKEKRIQDFKKS